MWRVLCQALGKQQKVGLGQSRGENSQPANDHILC